MATTLGSSRDRVYVGRLLARLEHILLSRIHGFRVSGEQQQQQRQRKDIGSWLTLAWHGGLACLCGGVKGARLSI